VVLELSATPHAGANILASASGQELLDEDMIKLPINVANIGGHVLEGLPDPGPRPARAVERAVKKHFSATGQYIRPIVLVQVERTGKGPSANPALSTART